jgi:Domain of unknown function (DUF4123)
MQLGADMDHASSKQAQRAQDEARLLAEVDAAIDSGLTAAAIVDPASFAQAWSQFGTLANARSGGSLFIGGSQAHDPAVAPLLLPLQRADSSTHAALMRVARHAPAVIWLASDMKPRALVEALAAKLPAELADRRQPITLRYYDPRVLPELLRVLDDKQQCHLNDGIRVWWWLDRRNTLARNAPAAQQVMAEKVSPFAAAIALSDDQVHRLLDASFIDRVLGLIERSSRETLRLFDRGERCAIASRLIEAAAAHGLVSEFDCANYIAVALQNGDGFAEQPEWVDLMSEVKSGAMRFTDAIEQWEQRRADAA